MQFLKTLLVIMLAVVFMVFAYNNWQAVTIDLWSGLQMVTKLPVVLLVAFLVGFLPLWAYHRTSSWRLKRRIATLEANQTRAATVASPVVPAPVAPPVVDTPDTTISEPASAMRSV